MLNFWNASMAKPLEDYRLQSAGRVTLVLLSESDCPNGRDSYSQSCKLGPDCPYCHGAGVIIAKQFQSISARVVWGNTQFKYIAPTPGIQTGDVTLTIVPGDQDTMQAVLDSERSYIIVDDVVVRPTNMTPEIVPGIEEAFLVTCSIYFNPQY